MRPAAGGDVVGAVWYKTILQDAVCPLDDGGIGGYYDKPEGFAAGDDDVYWGVVLPTDALNAGWSVQTLLNGSVATTTQLKGTSGMYWGSCRIGAGNVQLKVLNEQGEVLATASWGGVFREDVQMGSIT